LYIQYRDGVPDEDRRRLYQHARLTLAEQDAVNALVHFGVRISRVCNTVSYNKPISYLSTGPQRQRHQEEDKAESESRRIRTFAL
jgi:hypothetical protein